MIKNLNIEQKEFINGHHKFGSRYPNTESYQVILLLENNHSSYLKKPAFGGKFPSLDTLIQTRVLTNQSTHSVHLLFYKVKSNVPSFEFPLSSGQKHQMN